MRVVETVLKSGERHSVLVDEHGLPDWWSSMWVIEKLRPQGGAANTISTKLRAVMLLCRALPQAQDLTSRLARGEWLSVSEIDHLIEQMGLPADSITALNVTEGDVNRTVKRRFRVVSLENLRSKLRIQQQQMVTLRTKALRLQIIREYLLWCINAHILRSRGQTKISLTILRDEIDTYIESKSTNIRIASGIGDPKGLSEIQQAELIEVIQPSSPLNPWKNDPFIRSRNQLLVELFLACGPRRGAILGIKVADIDSHVGRISVLRRPDDLEDPRTVQTGNKRGDYKLPLGDRLFRLLREYQVLRHKKVKGRHQYLIVSEDGNPLEQSSVNYIFRSLRKVPQLANLHPHLLRHTWASNHARRRYAEGASIDEIEKELRTLGGWSERSNMPAYYTRQFADENSYESSLRLQNKATPIRTQKQLPTDDVR
jgi:integrase